MILIITVVSMTDIPSIFGQKNEKLKRLFLVKVALLSMLTLRESDQHFWNVSRSSYSNIRIILIFIGLLDTNYSPYHQIITLRDFLGIFENCKLKTLLNSKILRDSFPFLS